MFFLFSLQVIFSLFSPIFLFHCISCSSACEYVLVILYMLNGKGWNICRWEVWEGNFCFAFLLWFVNLSSSFFSLKVNTLNLCIAWLVTQNMLTKILIRWFIRRTGGKGHKSQSATCCSVGCNYLGVLCSSSLGSNCNSLVSCFLLPHFIVQVRTLLIF